MGNKCQEKKKMSKECSECGNEMKKVEVHIEDANTTVSSMQCPSCGHAEFDQEDAKAVVSELRNKDENKLAEIEKKLKEYGERLKLLERMNQPDKTTS